MKRKAGATWWLQGAVPASASATGVPQQSAYADRKDLAKSLAPPAPPCFNSRDQWVTYVQSSAEAQREKHAPGPLLFRKGEPVTFNREFFFCADCKAAQANAMWLEGRCVPNYLMTLPELVVVVTKEGADVPAS